MEQHSINLHVFARRHNEANSATEREIAAPRKISDLRPGTEDSGVRNDIPIAFIVNWFKVNSWRTFHKSASAKSEKQNHPFLILWKG
jgi:hypothetical protein